MPPRSRSADPIAPAQASFEQSLNALEALIIQLEKGELPLEESIQLFEKGMQLSSACQKALDEAQQKVSTLIQPGSSTPDP